MQNRIESGKALNYTVAGSAVKSGDVVALGGYCGIANTDGAVGDIISLSMEGVFSVKKHATLAIAQGDKVYWDNTAKEVTKTNTDVVLGYGWIAAAGSDGTVQVWLAKW